MANKTKKEACTRPGRGGRSKHYSGRGRPRRQRKIKEEKQEIKSTEEGERPVVSVKEDAPQNNAEEKVPRGSSGGCFYWCCVKRAGERRARSLRWRKSQPAAASAAFATLPTRRCFISPPELPPVVEPPSKKVKIEESFVLSEQQQQLIREDTANKKLWDEALDSLKEGPVRITPTYFSPIVSSGCRCLLAVLRLGLNGLLRVPDL